MRYITDLDGYLKEVSFGADIECDGQTCVEYTGAVPEGYLSLEDWYLSAADNACINAYYIDSSGNLMFDAERQVELEAKANKETGDNTPVLRKELFEAEEALASPNIKNSGKGKILTFADVLNVSPFIKLTDIDPSQDTVTIFAHSQNMLGLNHTTVTEAGLTIEWLDEQSGFVFTGTASAAFEFILSGNANDSVPIFALLKGRTYSLDVGGLTCELRYYNGETTETVYSGVGGQIVLPESRKVTHVVLKIPSGFSRETGFLPTLCDGSSVLANYTPPDCKTLTLDISRYIEKAGLVYPSASTFPGASTFPAGIEFIEIRNGAVNISVNGKVHRIGLSDMRLLPGYNFIYADQFATIEVEYTTNKEDIKDLSQWQGKATTSGKFEILKDGSIRANDGYFNNGHFNGEVQSAAGKIGGWNIAGTSLWCYIIPPADFTQSDVDKMQKYTIGEATLTDAEKELYDINKDGVVSSADVLFVSRFIAHGLTRSNPGKLVLDTSDWFKPIKVVNSNGEAIAWFGPGGAGKLDA